ncbi:hypothetical protein [Streptomyces atroolivaceus]|uniref:hypothetical protein n=1 Tax=Streptomyces atroolivaceus TaxID=66869 RepID=UPI00343739E6
MDLIADSVIHVYGQRDRLTSGLAFTHEPETLRFFQARFTPTAPDSVLNRPA